MSPPIKALITLLLLAGFGAAGYFAWQDRPAGLAAVPAVQRIAAGPALNGWIAVDVEPFFNDPQVQAVLQAHGLPVQVQRIGSRDMAARLGTAAAAPPDFLFPSGVVAANQITETARQARVGVETVAPFHTPMVIASWEPIARILVANGLATPLEPKVYGVDMAALTALMLARKRWNELKASSAYDVARSVLVSTTDVRRSNSAALYLALTAQAVHGDMVTDRATAQQLGVRLAGLFKRQGYQENYVNGNFDDYVAIGIGKAPMAFIYEHQLVAHALARGGIGPDMVLMYPQPTLINKVVFMATSARARALGELLVRDARLQELAVQHGFRIADAERFVRTVQPTGLAVQPRLTRVVDPPSFEVMAEMIDAVSREMAQ